MNIRNLIGATVALLACQATAESVFIDSLGDLELRYTSVESVEHYPGQPLAARVAYRPGEAISLLTPRRVQQIRYLVDPGTTVDKGQPIALLSGPEIHHFMTEFDYTGLRLTVAKRRFDNNRALYESNSIDEARWIEISDAYYALELEYEHMRHFRDLLLDDAGDSESLTLLSPGSGTLVYSNDSPGIGQDQEVARVIPANARRLQLWVPLQRREGLVAVDSGECRHEVDRISGVAEDFFVQSWSTPLDHDCGLLIGQRLMVTPLYAGGGFRVSRDAVFQWQGEPAVLLRQQRELVLIRVQILSSQGRQYIVASGDQLGGRDVLSSSVSAVQGLLLGLGGE